MEKKITSGAVLQPHALRAKLETEELIACFTGRETLDKFMDSLNTLIEKLDKDGKVKQYLHEMKMFILQENPTKAQDYGIKSRDLARRGRELMKEIKCSDEVNNFMDCTDQLMENFKNDEFVSVLRQHAGIVSSDLTYTDTDGRVQLDTQMISKLQSTIAPLIAETLKYIPVPRISESDENRDFWVDNIVLCGYDIVPDKIRLRIESDSCLGIRETETNYSDTRLMIELRNIRTELKDMNFFYNRKSFPKLTEQGRVTIRIGGEGASAVLLFIVTQGKEDKVPVFSKGDAFFHIEKLTIEFDKETLTHDVLFPMITNLFKEKIKRSIEKQVEESLRNIMQTFSEKLPGALLQVNRPFMEYIQTAREALKSSSFTQTYNKRLEKLE